VEWYVAMVAEPSQPTEATTAAGIMNTMDAAVDSPSVQGTGTPTVMTVMPTTTVDAIWFGDEC
jgi:hypothetical protein